MWFNLEQYFINKVRDWIKIFWDQKLITYDENIYEILLQIEPQITKKYYGRYWYFFDNWSVIRHYDEWYLINMSSCRKSGEHSQVIDMYEKLKVYQWNKMKNEDKWNVFYEVVISSYYVDKQTFIKICEEFVHFLESNKTDKKVMKILKINKDRILGNLSFSNFSGKDLDVKVIKLLEEYG